MNKNSICTTNLFLTLFSYLALPVYKAQGLFPRLYLCPIEETEEVTSSLQVSHLPDY